MKTVLEELEEDIYKLKESKCYINPNNFARNVIDLINYYKEKEKQQIAQAFDFGYDRDDMSGEEYFKHTYGTVSKQLPFAYNVFGLGEEAETKS